MGAMRARLAAAAAAALADVARRAGAAAGASSRAATTAPILPCFAIPGFAIVGLSSLPMSTTAAVAQLQRPPAVLSLGSGAGRRRRRRRPSPSLLPSWIAPWHHHRTLDVGRSCRPFSHQTSIVLAAESSSSSAVVDDDVLETENEEGKLSSPFATSYHAPVMPDECVAALLAMPGDDDDRRRRRRNRRRHRREGGGNGDSGDETKDAEDAGEGADHRRRRGRIFVDGTLGGGGHSAALLSRLSPGDIVVGCDVDAAAIEAATRRLSEYFARPSSSKGKVDEEEGEDGEKEEGIWDGTNGPIFVPVQSNFADLVGALSDVRHPVTGEALFRPTGDEIETDDGVKDDDEAFVGADGILLDLGVSSHQIDSAERGFAFMKHGPLDMRMSSGGTLTAADICNEFDETELVRILRSYGNEPRAKKVARAIVHHRPLSTTTDLVEAVASVVPEFVKKGRRMGRTATLARVFQSLRIVVNEEDRVLREALEEMAPAVLRRGGRLVVLSYHSMEDGATKRMMRDGTIDKAFRTRVERDMYGNVVGPLKPFRPVGKKRKAAEEEVAVNPRARSATLRIAERL